jgi:hypothetical protein
VVFLLLCNLPTQRKGKEEREKEKEREMKRQRRQALEKATTGGYVCTS